MTEDDRRSAARTRAERRSDETLGSPLERLLERSLLAHPRTSAVASAAPITPVSHPGWRRRYAIATIGSDAVLLTVAAAAAYVARLGSSGTLTYLLCTVTGVPAWLAFLAAGRCYEARYLGVGTEEVTRVFNASVRFVAGAALLALLAGTHGSRGFLVVAMLLGTALLLVERAVAHHVLRRLRRSGRCQTRAVVVGDRKRIIELIEQVEREPDSGFTIVGACTSLIDAGGVVPGTQVPVVGPLTGAVRAVSVTGADTVAVTASAGITPTTLRRLGWELEGTGVTLVVAPGLTDVAGPRIQVRPVGSRLPLLEVDEPEFTGIRKLLKNAQDRVLAVILFMLLTPILLAIAVAVRLDSRGSVLFRQTRVGRHGRDFTVYKFRSMHVDAEETLHHIVDLNQGNEVLFKVRDDPRVTRVGGVIRRLSLDELPQLLNVVKGDMALVGPRPPLPREVAKYGGDVRRRLLVKPGITGLWQVGGRSDLSWEDAVRLDLYYVENWSLALDLSILARTIGAVVRGSGAY